MTDPNDKHKIPYWLRDPDVPPCPSITLAVFAAVLAVLGACVYRVHRHTRRAVQRAEQIAIAAHTRADAHSHALSLALHGVATGDRSHVQRHLRVVATNITEDRYGAGSDDPWGA